MQILNQGLCSEPIGVRELVSVRVISTAKVDALLSVEKPHTDLEMIELANVDMPVSLETCHRDFNIVTETIHHSGWHHIKCRTD